MELYAEERGTGQPVVFLHPGLADSGIWEPQWQAYDPPYRLVRCDLPGFGRTGLEAGKVCIAGDVEALLERLGVTGAALVGCSFGASIALELAVARPELVRSIVLVGATMPGLERSEDERRADAAEHDAIERGDIDAAVEAMLRMWVDGPRRAPGEVDPAMRAEVGAMCRTMLEIQVPIGDDAELERLVPDMEEHLAAIEQPALVLVGTGDVEYIVRSADLLVEALPNARKATIPDAGHVPNIEQPAAFDALVLPFLAETT
jgi:pimeloyl-ACP methyl ester carboxylesterase